MADIANQLEGAVEGLDRFLEALDNSSMKLGSNAAIESKLARAAAKKADQELRFKKKIDKMEKEIAKREAQYLAQLKAAEPFRKKVFASLKQELKAKSDLIKQTKGLGDVFKKTGAGLGGMFKALGSGMSKALGAFGKGFTGATGLLGGLKDVLGKLMEIEIAGFSVGKAIGAAVAGAKLLHDFMSSNEKVMKDIAKSTGVMFDPDKPNKYYEQVKKTYKVLGDYGYTMKETVKLTQDLREAFGDVSYVTSEMVQTSAELQMNYKIATEDANELVEAMARSGYEGDKFLKTVETMAITMGSDVGMAMRDVAKNTQMMELYAGRGEEYFARMASRAALLGTNMQSIESSGQAFEDFDQMAENMNVTAQLFGDGFNDGLKNLQEIRMMYERGNILGIQEHYSQQIAKTMEYRKVEGKWLLINKNTNEEMYQSAIKQAGKSMGMDNVSAIRAIKAAEMQNMLKMEGFEITEKMLKAQGASTAEIELFQASQFDHSMAMFSQLRESGKSESEIIEMLSKSGKEGIRNREELLRLSIAEGVERAKVAEFQEDLPTKTLAMMTDLEGTMAKVNKTMERVANSIGEKMTQQFGDKKGSMVKTFNETIEGFGDEFVRSMEASDVQTGVMSAINNATLAGVKGALAAAFEDLTLDKLKDMGWVETMTAGFNAAFVGEGGVSPAGTLVDSILAEIELKSDQFQSLFKTILGGAVGDALADVAVVGQFTDAARATTNVSGDPSSPGFKDAYSTLQLERGLKGTGGSQLDSATLANALDNIVQEATDDEFMVRTTEMLGMDRRLLDAMLTLAASNDEVTLTAADLADGFIDFKKGGFDKFTEDVDDFLLAQLEGGATFAQAVAQLRDQQTETNWSRRITSLTGQRRMSTAEAFEARNSTPTASGWAGSPHRAIVGEAGTEVGITKSALRELASAGIPGYQNGANFVADLMGNRPNLTQAAGSGPARAGRAEAAEYAGEAYRDTIRTFEQDFLDVPRKQHDVWAKDSKEFFTKYPAVVDEAIGAPFRQAGPVATGLYNSVFSGMQAATRAELAGADKDTQRQLMYQHMTAEGLKPNGIISQGLNKLSDYQTRMNKTFGEGFAKEEEKLVEMTKQENEFLKAAKVARKAGNMAANKAAWEQINILRESKKVQEKQISELKELQKRGEGWNRATVGLLGGINSGMSAFAGVIASGGTREQAMEMGKRAGIGGLVRDLSGTWGAADQGFLSGMNTLSMLMGTTPLPPYAGKNVREMMSTAMSRTEDTFQSRGRGLDWGGTNATGRVYTSPHLAVVGEGSQNEVVIPTERIRKGLPINAGVAKELGSIGVPGYLLGFGEGDVAEGATSKGMIGFSGMYEGGKAFEGSRAGAGLENIESSAGVSLATAGMQFANMYQQTGDMGYSIGQGLGAGIGMAATAGLAPFLGPFAPLAGGLIGSFVGNKLGKWMAYKPKYEKARGRAIKTLREHVMTEGKFMHGAPPGISAQITKAISGKGGKYPSEKALDKLISGVTNDPVLSYGFGPGHSSSMLLALLSGQMGNTAEENQAYAKFNQTFYGTPMAKGGIVTKPTNAVIGEAGPEAVIPLGQHGGYASRQQQDDQKNIITELRKQNQQMGMFIKNIGSAKTVLNVDGRELAEAVGKGMYDINSGV